jgi:hypothetical protein
MWTGRVEQWMADPLWKAPGRDLTVRCNDECDDFEEDNGSCKADYVNEDLQTICIYPMRPWEEALCSKPEEAPELPAGSRQVGCADYVENRDADPPVANPAECDPTYQVGEDGSRIEKDCAADFLAPWAIQGRQEQCIADNGRFADDYTQDGGGSVEFEFVP